MAALLPLSALAQSASDRVRITNLSDVSFDPIADSTVDLTRTQSICVHARPAGTIYQVTATGSGAGGTFTLGSGSSNMDYEVQWADSPGQTVGTALTAGLPLSNQNNASNQTTCSGGGPSTTASLIIILRAASFGSASSGSYTGTLSLVIAPN